MMNDEKFLIIDGTDDMCIGGFGNDKGNIELLKYCEKEIAKKMLANNSKDDDIRLVNSLLRTIKNYKEIIDKAIEYIRSEYTITDDDVYLALYSSDGTLDKLENILKGSDNNE